MLFTDSDLVQPYDLVSIDGEAASVASSIKGQLSGVQSAIRQGWIECSSALNNQLQSYTAYFGAPGTQAHLMAVFNSSIYSNTAPRVLQNRIIAHDWRHDNSLSPCQLWLVYTALKILYVDASNRLGKDRYQDKAKRFSQRAIDAWEDWKAQGLPTAYAPLDCPGAIHQRGAGQWSANTNTTATATGGQYVVAITYYDAAAYVSQANKGNAESGPSNLVPVTAPVNRVIQVDISGLNPPDGGQSKIGLSEGLTLARPATHWNVYVGNPTTDGSMPVMYWQASSPIATKTYTLAGNPNLSGSIMDQGQFPDPGGNMVFGGRTIARG